MSNFGKLPCAFYTIPKEEFPISFALPLDTRFGPIFARMHWTIGPPLRALQYPRCRVAHRQCCGRSNHIRAGKTFMPCGLRKLGAAQGGFGGEMAGAR